MDIRIEKTERAIRTAFLALRAQKPLEKITVKELCAAAYINKSTFYAHYEDLFALSDTLEREAVDAILQDIGEAGTYSLDTPEAFARALCISFHAHLPTINVLFSGKAQNRLADRLETGIKAHIFAVYPAWRQDPVMQIALWKTHRYSHSVYGLSTSFCTILIVRKNITQIHTKHTGGTGLGCVCAI